MSENYHTPIPVAPVKPDANSETFNAPLAQLDQAISDLALTEKDGHIIQYEGVDVAQQQRLNFTGAGVTATNDPENGRTKVEIDARVVSVVAGAGISINGTDPKNPIVSVTNLVITSAAVTTSNVTGVEGTLHNLDISGTTANRDFNLPTPSASGKRVGVRLSTGDDTYALVIKRNGSEWSRLFVTGEIVIFVSTGTNPGDWAIENDGRISCTVKIKNSNSQNISNGVVTTLILDEMDYDNASCADIANNRILVRRTNIYEVTSLTDWNFAVNGNLQVLTQINSAVYISNSRRYSLATEITTHIDTTRCPLSAGDNIRVIVFQLTGANLPTNVGTLPVSLQFKEVFS